MRRPIWRFNVAPDAVARQLMDELSVDLLFCQLLVERGIDNSPEAREFFRPSMEHLHDPFLMKDMDIAVERLRQAVRDHERILLYGDYDVDGTTSVAMMYAFLSGFNKNLDYYIPDRDKEGYGISQTGVEYAKETGCTLVVAMDCGIKAHSSIAYAKSLGIDFIVCDHHVPEGELPVAVANLDPKRSDCPYPYKELSGCGISFKLAQAFAQRNNTPVSDLEYLLDLVTVSIACDIVPMTGENRTLAYFGLRKLNHDPRVGLWALVQRSGRHYPLNVNDLVFGLGPLINAAGRLGDAKDAVQLLLASDKQSALDEAGALVDRNRQRREVDFSTTEIARERFQNLPDWLERKSVVLFDPDWHKGIIGIAASRMVEAFHRPAVIMTMSEGVAVGSARSIPGFDLYEALQECEYLFHSFGGHSHAAGMQLPVDNVPIFAEKFEQLVKEKLTPDAEQPVIDISAELPLNQITPKFWRVLKQFAPFGPGNMNPIFIARDVVDTGRSRLLDNNHVRFAVKQGNDTKMWTGIGFGLGEKFEKIRNRPFDIAYSIQEGNWRGEKVLSIIVKDIR